MLSVFVIEGDILLASLEYMLYFRANTLIEANANL